MTEHGGSIEPNRPWLYDPADAPRRMNWLGTFFNPFGETSRVHFTRALTILFFASTPFGFMMLGAAGSPDGFPTAFGGIAVITLISFIAHLRRMASARRPAILAAVALLPVVLAGAAFVAIAAQSVPAANEALAQYQADLADPEAARARALAERERARADAAIAGEAAGDDGRRSGGPVKEKPGYKDGAFSPIRFVLQKAAPPAVMTWMVSGLLVFLWTLLWAARLPNGGGTIRERLAYEATLVDGSGV